MQQSSGGGPGAYGDSDGTKPPIANGRSSTGVGTIVVVVVVVGGAALTTAAEVAEPPLPWSLVLEAAGCSD